MKKKRGTWLCWTDDDDTWAITLTQQGVDSFTVTYGLQIDTGLNYANAAAKLGEAIMHKAACNGTLDNREKGERR